MSAVAIGGEIALEHVLELIVKGGRVLVGGLRLLLSSALRRGNPDRGQEAMREAVAHIEREIGNLRAIITELRPAALDELGLRTAIEGLLDPSP